MPGFIRSDSLAKAAYESGAAPSSVQRRRPARPPAAPVQARVESTPAFVNADRALEREADVFGARVANGERVTVPGTPSASRGAVQARFTPSSAAVVQCKPTRIPVPKRGNLYNV